MKYCLGLFSTFLFFFPQCSVVKLTAESCKKQHTQSGVPRMSSGLQLFLSILAFDFNFRINLRILCVESKLREKKSELP